MEGVPKIVQFGSRQASLPGGGDVRDLRWRVEIQ